MSNNLRVAHIRLNSAPESPGGIDGYIYLADVYKSPADHTTVEFQVSRTTRAQVPVNEEGFNAFIERDIAGIVAAWPADDMDRILADDKPHVIGIERFPDFGRGL